MVNFLGKLMELEKIYYIDFKRWLKYKIKMLIRLNVWIFNLDCFGKNEKEKVRGRGKLLLIIGSLKLELK